MLISGVTILGFLLRVIFDSESGVEFVSARDSGIDSMSYGLFLDLLHVILVQIRATTRTVPDNGISLSVLL